MSRLLAEFEGVLSGPRSALMEITEHDMWCEVTWLMNVLGEIENLLLLY